MLGRLLFSFNGRMPRRQFWFYVLGFIVLAVLVTTLTAVVLIAREPDIAQLQLDAGLRFSANIFLLVMLWPTLAVSTKRLHDCNSSAWWLVFFFGAGAAFVYAMDFLKIAFGTTSVLVYSFGIGFAFLVVWFVGELGLRPGTKGENRFGTDPNADSVAASDVV